MKCRLCGLEGPLFKDGTCRGDGCELRQAENEADALRAELARAEREKARYAHEVNWHVERTEKAEADLARARGLLEDVANAARPLGAMARDARAFLAGTAPPAPACDETCPCDIYDQGPSVYCTVHNARPAPPLSQEEILRGLSTENAQQRAAPAPACTCDRWFGGQAHGPDCPAPACTCRPPKGWEMTTHAPDCPARVP